MVKKGNNACPAGTKELHTFGALLSFVSAFFNFPLLNPEIESKSAPLPFDVGGEVGLDCDVATVGGGGGGAGAACGGGGGVGV